MAKKKFLSLIVIPHTRSSSRTFSLSKRFVKLVLWGGIVVGLMLLGITADYFRIQFSHQNYRSLLSENQNQKEKIKKYETTIDVLEKRVKGFEDYAKKLNVMAGITTDVATDGTVRYSVGDYPRDGQALPSGVPPQLSTANLQSMQQKADDVQKNLDTLANFFDKNASLLASTPSIWPTAGGWPSSGFGYRIDPFTKMQAFHYGLDIVAAFGNPVIAPADGYVLEVNRDNLFGNWIILNHGGGITTLYGHLSKTSVRVGQKVKRGDEIGKVGNTGKSIGPHLHYEVRINGKAVNPYSYILEEH
jgi:murein DD-endopeptidase MepM/ murein hydrolase activator NlpD